MKKSAKRPVGRPGAGVRPGENVRDYQRFTLRLPADVRAELSAAAGALNVAEWRVVVEALRAYVGTGQGLTTEQQKVIRSVARLHEQRSSSKPTGKASVGKAVVTSPQRRK